MRSSHLTATVVLLDSSIRVDREPDVRVTLEPGIATQQEVHTEEVLDFMRHCQLNESIKENIHLVVVAISKSRRDETSNTVAGFYLPGTQSNTRYEISAG